MEYDDTSEKMLCHLKWSLPINHTGLSQEIVWSNEPHAGQDQVDAGRKQHVSKAADTHRKTLQLRPWNQYKVYVSVIYKIVVLSGLLTFLKHLYTIIKCT